MAEHVWQFVRAGGVEQVVIHSGADIAHIGQLDQKLWVALACPVEGVEFDPATLALIDTDHDGRIRPPELIAACEWACARVADPEQLVRGGDRLTLDMLAPETAASQPLRDEVHEWVGPAAELRLDDMIERRKAMAERPFNGDGLVTPQAAEDPALKAFIEVVVRAQGGRKDRSGEVGVGLEELDAFVAHLQTLKAWHLRPGQEPALAPLGEHSLAAARAVHAVRDKVDDFFTRCRLAAYDPLAVPALNPALAAYQALPAQALSGQDAGIASLPLAAVAPGAALPLAAPGLNPAWSEPIHRLWRDALEPWRAWSGRGGETFAAGRMDALEWSALVERLAPCLQWLQAQPGDPLRDSTVAELDGWLSPALHDALRALIQQDEAAGPQFERMADLEKLLRLQRDLFPLLRNFVSFIDFYRREPAIFQAGRLYLDARSCDLTLRVPDPARHAALAGMAKTCLAYCECRREGRKMNIVAAFTAGDVDFLFVGRNGVFYDRQGRDWDATITRLIENPTSIGQAFFSPYKKFLRMVEEQVAKRAAASDAAAQGRMGQWATRAASVGAAPAPGSATPAAAAPAAPAAASTASPAAAALAGRGRFDVGTIAALGVALGSLSTVLVAVFGKFVDLGWWIPAALLGIVLAISGPSMLIAWLKLRQRSLGPLLDASGWAINGRMRVNMRLGASLSRSAHLPAQARLARKDPFAENHAAAQLAAAGLVVAGLLALAWRAGWLARWSLPWQG